MAPSGTLVWSWALGSPEATAPGTRGRPAAGEPWCPERAVRADSGSPVAPGGRAVGPRALDGVDGAGLGTKAHALKFKSHESGPRISMLTVSQVRRWNVLSGIPLCSGQIWLSYLSSKGQNGGVIFYIFVFQGEVATFKLLTASY